MEETKDKFNENLDQVEMSSKVSDWQQAKKQIKKIKKQYDKHLWKMQLLGEDKMYNNIELSIDQLKAAVKSQNKSEITKQIETIKYYLSVVFG